MAFYWGGIREFGLLYFSLIPFFIAGIFSFSFKRLISILIIPVVIFCLLAISSAFPENRLVYLAVPFPVLLVTEGIYNSWGSKNLSVRILAVLICFLFVYEFSQFLHHYFVHYPIDVRTNIEKIIRPF